MQKPTRGGVPAHDVVLNPCDLLLVARLAQEPDSVAEPEVHGPGQGTSAPPRRQVLFDTAAESLALAVCDWAGLPLADTAVADLSRDCTAMVDGFASPGPRHVRAHRARARQEQALAKLVTDVRATRADAVTEGSALGAVARHRDADGDPSTLGSPPSNC